MPYVQADPGLLSLYDKALGEQATAFVTCTDERATVCTQCARYDMIFLKRLFITMTARAPPVCVR